MASGTASVLRNANLTSMPATVHALPESRSTHYLADSLTQALVSRNLARVRL